MTPRKIKTPAGIEYRAKRWGTGGLTLLQEKQGGRWYNCSAMAVYPERADAILDRLAQGQSLSVAFQGTRGQ